LAQNTIKFSGIPHPLSCVNKPISYKINSTSIFIEAGEKTDMFRDPNVTYNTDNAPRLSFTADPNFVLTAEIHHDFISKWDGGAIVLEADKMNWIKFCFEKDYTGMHRVVSVVTKDISDDCNSVAIMGNDVFYKIAKADNVITLYYSTDGKKWFLIRHLQFNTAKPIKLGFLAQSPTGKNSKVTFSNITYSTRKIKDPYTGE
jgi:regulation of enolase protein 1 (concanavalin A-like superfamily)